ncbi:PREDICTED: F-box protein At5g07610 [Theobroma cacao]|uniref:F-box protein At5g07610 n=1 Tax=Theobroma cacao TaxID=3641 RepID=A0AB32WF02_THECC|nr:PREDICTED: F-box protein At5g07610 [Theobroma cacao]
MVTTRSSARLRANITSAEKVANSEDLLQEILLRLPTKTLLRFKLVSKPWLSLISSTHFSLTHTRFLQNNRSLKPHAFFLDVLYKKLPSKFKFLRLNPNIKRLPPFDFIDAPRIRIIQSCVGLLLCVSESDYGLRYFICNPATKKFKVISVYEHEVIYNSYEYVANNLGLDPSESAKLFMDYDQRASVNLAFDPTIEVRRHAGVNLAFDPLISPHYKIFSIWQQLLFGKDPESTTCYIFPTYFIDIYSSETNSWSASKINFNSKHNINIDRAVFFNGAIHWDCADTQSWYIDVNNECLKTMPMPGVHSGFRYFGESGGHLHLVVAKGFSQLKFKIFEMETDYSNWYLKYNVHLEAETFTVVPRRQQNRMRSYLLSCVVQSDEDEGDSILVVLPNGFAISYNLEDGIVKRLRCSNIDKDGHDGGRFHAFPYFETLSCL